MQMYLIKSGPGCGKSTLMKRLAVKAEQKGEPIQRIHCASDPDSLDGVIFLDKRAAIVDATAPHVMEPDAPGAEEQVVSLYHTLDADALHAHADEVKRLFAQNTALRSRAARYIASAGSLLLDSRRAEACSANFEKSASRLKRLCARTLPRLPEGALASEELRLLSAITPKGPVFYRGTVQALADRYVVFHDDYGAVSRLLHEGSSGPEGWPGHYIITCPCAMHPDDKIDHLFAPALGWLSSPTTDGAVHARRASHRCTRCGPGKSAGYRARLRFNRRAAAELWNRPRPDGTGQKPATTSWRLTARRRGLPAGGRNLPPLRRDAGAGVGWVSSLGLTGQAIAKSGLSVSHSQTRRVAALASRRPACVLHSRC